MYLVLMSIVAAIFPPVLPQQTLPITVQQGVLDKCPSDEAKEDVVQNIIASFHSMLDDFSFDLTAVPTTARATTLPTTPGFTPATTPGSTSATTPATIPCEEESIEYVLAPQCGEGVWRKVVSLNMSDPSQQCPSPWREYTSIRSCGRPENATGCESVKFNNTCNLEYTRVCGRAIGYQYGTADCFHRSNRQLHIIGTPDDTYVDGLSITHGTNPREHIWTFAVGLNEPHEDAPYKALTCPCAAPDDSRFGTVPPSYVGNKYFCDAPTTTLTAERIHYTEPLWDGNGCVNSQCCSFNTPPWFSAQLSNSTTDDIEVRICGDEPTSNEDTTVELLEIFIQ